jgi:hypothetical protein
VKDNDAARQQRVKRIEQRIERLEQRIKRHEQQHEQRIKRLSGQLKEARRKLDEARIPRWILDFQREIRCTARTTIPSDPIPDHALPHYRAALEAERECQEDLENANGNIEREIAEEALKAATAARERMWLDIHEFGGWLHDERKQLSRRGRPPDPEVEYKSKRIAADILLLEQEGLSPKAAVADAANRHGVSRSTAYDARKRWHPQLRQFGYGSTHVPLMLSDEEGEDDDDRWDEEGEDDDEGLSE